VQIKLREGEKYFVIDKMGTFADYEVLHLMGLSWNGIEGISVMEAAREAIGMGLAAQQFGAEFFGNGANLGGVITHPAKLTDDSMKRLKESWRRNYQGNDKSHGTAILEEGMKYDRIGIPPDQAQFLETRKFQILDIARIFRVPPHMLGELDAAASRANIEEQGISFVRDTIRPIVTMWEDELNKKLFMPSEQGRMYVRFNLDSLLRGDTASRFSSYAVARQWGWLSVNDIRDLENMNPIDGGDIYLQPLNMVNAAEQPNDTPID
jgi:HK97 family phage portal protein